MCALHPLLYYVLSLGCLLACVHTKVEDELSQSLLSLSFFSAHVCMCVYVRVWLLVGSAEAAKEQAAALRSLEDQRYSHLRFKV